MVHFGHSTSAEVNSSKAGSPRDGGGCRKSFLFAVVESTRIGETGEKVSSLKDLKGPRKLVVTLHASFATRAIPTSAPDTDDDDGCAQQGEGAGAAGPKAGRAEAVQ